MNPNQQNVFSPNANALANANPNANLATKTLGNGNIHPAVQGMMDHYNSLPPEHIAQIGMMHPEIQKAFNKLQAPQAQPIQTPPPTPMPMIKPLISPYGYMNKGQI